ncbi:N-6 DNA methylase [Brachyspira hyodysenteriae]|uniref:Eco57I restriction-modification methylase domain-containing protein n=1 Tax=Brachyspira hyodysenteriae TaxID=159 RepID=UPI002B261DAB|nr:TaqI-like C-terminal specificity domain-containing protein [Brachyspira hyodysenteriae]WPC23571.1 N-6 DNA methylase [Brachyspira hyodysenteriae]
MYSKEEVYKKVEELVIKFRNNKDQYTNKNYNETETRRDFLDPFFEAFGWDVSNRAGKSQTYRDVIHEDKVKVGKETKAPDYAFRIGGNRVFFVEAKKPGVNLKEDNLPAFQLRRYGWSAKLGISFLTDFEELAVYDCTRKPNVNDKASTARIEYIHFEDYLNRFDFLYEILNKERIEQGSLEKYIAGTSNKKGTESVDIDFLNSLDSLRTKLASNIAKLNKNLSVRDLNYAVQQIIDRIIFLRAAEDRGIEEYGDLKRTCENKGESFYGNLLKIFEKADGRYNSGLFDFSKDSISSSIEIDNKVIKEIINELYYPLSPYEFSVISVEIIGNAYEQFLGKTITIGKNHSAKIELKPEVRKAGGVYYTPEYIVDYIVANTVGEAIKGKKPEEIANIKILDPACGSGSFLLGAYKYLLNYHIEYYNKIKDRAKFKGSKEDVIKENGDLTIWIKKQILRNNIFGVDIDSNAVEVTKLSLLMRCLEGESPASIQNNQDLFNERALPSLEDNIKCGNSLISNDFYESQSVLDFDEETQYKINCFDWEDEFKTIFKGGGFDVVIGNPPYVSIRTVDFNNLFKEYFKTKFTLAVGQYDLYSLFTELSYKVLNQNGIYSFILPKRLATNENFKELRKFYINNFHITEYVDAEKPFLGASVEANIIICSKSYKTQMVKVGMFKKGIYNYFQDIDIKFVDNMPFNLFPFLLKENSINLINKIELSNYSKLGSHCDIIRGFECGFNNEKINKEKSQYKMIRGENISRYIITEGEYYVHPDFKNESKIFKREEIFTKVPKMVTKFVSNNIEFALDEVGYCNTNVVYNVHIIDESNINYLLAVLNSKVVNFWFKNIYVNDDTLFPHIQKNQLESIPIPLLDMSNTQDKEMHDKMVALVDSIIALNKKLAVEKNPNAVTMVNRQINAIDKQIDCLVYKIYNLDENDIKIIEDDN